MGRTLDKASAEEVEEEVVVEILQVVEAAVPGSQEWAAFVQLQVQAPQAADDPGRHSCKTPYLHWVPSTTFIST